MKKAVSTLLLLGLLVDLFQIRDAIFGIYDFRLWQVLIAIIAMITIVSSKIKLSKFDLSLSAILISHTILVLIFSKSFNLPIIVQLVSIIAIFFVLKTSINSNIGEAIFDVYIVAASVLAMSMAAEFLFATILPDIANRTVYQILQHDFGPMGFTRAHGLMMEPSQVALILPPAIYLTLMRRRYLISSTFILCTLLSFSALTYIGLFCSVVLYIFFTKKFKGFAICSITLAAVCLAYMVEPIQQRVLWALKAPEFLAMAPTDARTLQGELAGSVGSLVLAIRVAAIDFSSNSFLGAGLGNFSAGASEVMSGFSQAAINDLGDSTALFSKVNSGGGLLIRIIGEFGAVGLFLLSILFHRIFRSVLYAKDLVDLDDSLRVHWRVQAIGLFVTVLFPYIIRKDIYMSIYLLVPFAAWALATESMEAHSRRIDVSRPPLRAGFRRRQCT